MLLSGSGAVLILQGSESFSLEKVIGFFLPGDCFDTALLGLSCASSSLSNVSKMGLAGNLEFYRALLREKCTGEHLVI